MTQLNKIAKLDELNFQACYAVEPVAQSVEQRTFNLWVDGPSPSAPTFVQEHPDKQKCFRNCAYLDNPHLKYLGEALDKDD